MQILWVHQNYPAQFGHIAARLAKRPGVECVYLSRAVEGVRDGVRCLRYRVKGGATRANHYCTRTFENAVWQAHAVYEACKAATDVAPDVIVGHSGFGSTVFLRELYRAPIVNYFEYYYRPHGTDMDFRPDFPASELDVLRSHARNAMILMDLEACAAGYTPSLWQFGLLPEQWWSKVQVIHDGIDTERWRRRPGPRRIGDEMIPDGTRIVTYVARGLEAMRGFDIFIRVANRIAAAMPNVIFVVVGADRTAYGNDLRHIRATSFREHVVATEKPDPARFRFLGRVPPDELAGILSLSDLHIYLTVPFVVSWSLLNAMATECVVLASDVAPVRDVVTHGQTGLLGEFFDVAGLTVQALNVLRDPATYRPLATAARALIEAKYSLDHTLPRLVQLLQSVTSPTRASSSPAGSARVAGT